MKLKNRNKELKEQVMVNHLFLLYILFFYLWSSLSAQNLDKIEFYEASKVMEQMDKNSKTPVIAVIDGGVRMDLFPEAIFAVNKNEIQNNGVDDDDNGYIDDYFGWNFADNSNDITNEEAGDWHGTPVLSLIHRMVSNNKNVQLMNLVKGNTIDEIKSSLKYVLALRRRYNETDGKEGVFIVAINCSWGKSDLWASDYTDWCSLYNELGEQGVLVVSSVPNDNINVDEVGDMPSTCNSDYLITTTNTNINDEKVLEAAFGLTSVDMSAPGNGSYTLLNTGEYGFFGGTSAAAPYISATVGLLYSLFIEGFNKIVENNPKKAANLIKNVLLEGNDKLTGLDSITLSKGRLNVYGSLRLLLKTFNLNDTYVELFKPLKIQKIYPNPIINEVNLIVESDRDESVQIDFLDLNGRIIKSLQSFVQNGIREMKVNLSNFKLEGGLYVLQVHTNSGLIDRKKIIVK